MSEEYIVRGQFVTAEKVERAKELRSNMTSAEEALWQRLRRSQLGLHFRRQQVIAGFIVDFYCHAASLVIEVAGQVHDYQRREDRERDTALRERGLETLRISNDEVSQNLAGVLARISDAIGARVGG